MSRSELEDHLHKKCPNGMTKCEECEIEVSNIEFIQDQHSCFETMKKKLREQKEEIQDFKILSGDIITPYHFYMKIRRTELQKIQTDRN